MRFELIDYSLDYFDTLPTERGGKFIQVMGGDTHYIIMAPRQMCTFHANIAERFFDSRGIRGRYNHKRDNYTLTHPEWALPGGGHWELNEEDRTLTLSGQSLAYGRFLSNGLAAEMERAMPGMKVIVKS